MGRAWVVLVIVGLLGAALLANNVPSALSGSTTAQSGALETAALRAYRGTWFQAYFTKPAAERDPNRRGGADEALAADIARAQHSVALASFDLDLGSVADALIAAHRRGVHVALSVDGENLADPVAAAVLGRIEDAGIAVTYDRRSAFMHNKIVVVDAAVVWTGSMNFTTNDTFRNNNNLVRVRDSELAATYRAKLEQIHAGRGGQRSPPVSADAPVRAMFAPHDPVTDLIVEQIQGARGQVDVLAFAFTSDRIADALLDAHERGVVVRVVMERRNTQGTGSVFAALRGAGVDIRPDGNCAIMHHKAMVIDREHTITGSFNFTDAAQEQNDENVLLIRDRSVAALFGDEFERVYNQALHPPTCEE